MCVHVCAYACMCLLNVCVIAERKVGSSDTLAPSYHNVVPVMSSQPVNIVQFFSMSATSSESITTTVS